MERIVIVGASLAGAHAARALRRDGHDGDVVMIGEEPHRPYDRPPLSKSFLAGESDEDRLFLRVVEQPDPLDVTWCLGRRAESLELATDGGGAIGLDDGSTVDGDGIIVATGSRPRTLPGQPDLAGLATLRTLDDARQLGEALRKGPDHLVVVGFGFIGAEVAATARGLGWEVTIVEAAAQPLTRVLGADDGSVVADLHREHGVDVRLGVGVDRVVGQAGRVAGLLLTTGETVSCSQVVVGIGAEPETGWLDGSGVELVDGVVADETLLAAPGVVAVGDVVRWPNPQLGGELIRVEQWDNAVASGAHGAERLLAWGRGDSVDPYAPVPWFWSDQYDRRIQLAGIATDASELVQGDVEERRFVRLYHGERGVAGALCWNRPRQAALARRLLAEGADIERFRDELS